MIEQNSVELTPSYNSSLSSVEHKQSIIWKKDTYETKLPKDAVAGDIVLFHKEYNRLCILDGETFDTNKYSADDFSPVGIVIVPSSHNLYQDDSQSCGVVSLKRMSYSNPSEGIPFGDVAGNTPCFGNDVPISSLHNYTCVPYVGTTDSPLEVANGYGEDAYLPGGMLSQALNGAYCPTDPTVKYYQSAEGNAAPSPYLPDGTLNSQYTQQAPITDNALGDLDGLSNTNSILLLATGQTDWQTSAAISNESETGFYPAACCCWRYHTDGTNIGDWYLPSFGESGYFAVRNDLIVNTMRDKLRAIFGDDYNGSTTGFIMSSTQFTQSSTHSYFWSVFPDTGNITHGVKNFNGEAVLAYLRIDENYLLPIYEKLPAPTIHSTGTNRISVRSYNSSLGNVEYGIYENGTWSFQTDTDFYGLRAGNQYFFVQRVQPVEGVHRGSLISDITSASIQ